MSWPPPTPIDNPLHITGLSPTYASTGEVYCGTPKVQSVIWNDICQLITLTGYINDPIGAFTLYVQLHESAVAIVAGAVPKVVIPVKGVQLFSLTQGLTFTPGLTIALSTTEWTYTAATAIMSFQCTLGHN